MLKIAIIGGTGLLGSNLVKLYGNYDVKAFSRKQSNNIENRLNCVIDPNNLVKDLDAKFTKWQPDIIINTVALVNLQVCENDYTLAYDCNVRIAKEIAELSNKWNSYFIHISTDHYYTDQQKFHSELSKIDIVNNYAKTKYIAEKEVYAINQDALIVRTNIIGFRNNEKDSFFEWLLNSLEKNIQINMYTNFFTSPISAKQLGEILIKCYHHKLEGIYNICSSEVIDKFSFGVKTAHIFDFKPDISHSELTNSKSTVVRALNLGLDTTKIINELNIQLPTIDETLMCLYQEYNLNKDE
jgi:dTDP-4-dehydrorhamnose reductase